MLIPLVVGLFLWKMPWKALVKITNRLSWEMFDKARTSIINILPWDDTNKNNMRINFS